MTALQLHELGARRRRDEDVRTLLWEIKRLWSVLIRVRALAIHLGRYDEDADRVTRAGFLLEVLGSEPAIKTQMGPLYWKPERDPPSENEGERRARGAQEDEREAKRQGRQKRG